MNGVKTKDGEVLRAKQARPLRSGQKNSWVEIILDEGKNRHIRRMMEALDVDVLRLVRVAIGPLQLGDLAKGKSRDLSAEEKTILDRALGRKLEAWSVH
jgi:23S rRNA pseudouridine2605 synthase